MTTLQSAILEIQTAMQARLTGDAILMAMITGVFDSPPTDQPLPYISYGQHVDGPYPTFGHINSEVYMLLDVWSGQSGDAECYTILAEMNRLLVTRPTTAPLSTPSYGSVPVSYDWSTILHEAEPEYTIRHMPVRYFCRAVEQV